ncbi:MAG: hypothetical protein ABJA77_15455 [Variovorax sp.]
MQRDLAMKPRLAHEVPGSPVATTRGFELGAAGLAAWTAARSAGATGVAGAMTVGATMVGAMAGGGTMGGAMATGAMAAEVIGAGAGATAVEATGGAVSSAALLAL